MLQVRTKEQTDKVLNILGLENVFCCHFPQYFGKKSNCVYKNDRLYIDGEITFDKMAEIVDYLRKDDNKRRANARRAVMKSNIDGLWVSGNAIFAKGADVEKAEAFILSLAKFGYDTEELLNEYKQTGKITI